MTSMTNVMVTKPSELRELSIDELGKAGGGLLGLFLLGFAIGWAIAEYNK